MTDAGGMYVRVSAIVDKNSFEESHKSVDGLDVSFNKLIGTVRNAGVVLAAMKGVKAVSGIGELETQSYKTAAALGITTDAFKLWSASAKIAGTNADSLFNAMNKVGNVLQNLSIDGEGANELAKKLGVNLGLGIEDLKENGEWLSADKAFEVILKKAEKLKADGMELSEIYLRLQKSVGTESADFFAELQREGVTLAEFQSGASKKILTDANSDKKSQDFAKEVRELKTTFGEVKSLFNSEIAGALTPAIEKLNDWLDKNGVAIKNAIEKAAGITGGVVDAGVETLTDGIPTLVDYFTAEEGSEEKAEAAKKIDNLANSFDNNPATAPIAKIVDNAYDNYKTNKSLKGDLDLIYQHYKDVNKENGKHWWNRDKLKYSDLDEDWKAIVDNYIALGGKGHLDYIEMQDGIMRPDGTIAKVAPDDWVFAARSVSDMARAFIPQNYSSVQGGNEISIVQNFTINGGSDMPQILRQQAYKGTQEGLLEIMNQSSRRLQLMSGTR